MGYLSPCTVGPHAFFPLHGLGCPFIRGCAVYKKNPNTNDNKNDTPLHPFLLPWTCYVVRYIPASRTTAWAKLKKECCRAVRW